MSYDQYNPRKQSSGGGIYWLLAVLAAIVVGVVSYLLFFQIQPPKKTLPVYEEPLMTEPAAEPYTPAEVEAPVVAEPVTPSQPEAVAAPKPLTYIPYTVKQDDMLTSISKKRYGTRFYWPLIFTKNEALLGDQDALQPGTVLMIPDTIDTAADGTLANLGESYIKAYKNYKKRGKDKKARWLLYACQTQVDPTILDTYKSSIDKKDLKVVRDYLKRFPNPEGER